MPSNAPTIELPAEDRPNNGNDEEFDVLPDDLDLRANFDSETLARNRSEPLELEALNQELLKPGQEIKVEIPKYFAAICELELLVEGFIRSRWYLG